MNLTFVGINRVTAYGTLCPILIIKDPIMSKHLVVARKSNKVLDCTIHRKDDEQFVIRDIIIKKGKLILTSNKYRNGHCIISTSKKDNVEFTFESLLQDTIKNFIGAEMAYIHINKHDSCLSICLMHSSFIYELYFTHKGDIKNPAPLRIKHGSLSSLFGITIESFDIINNKLIINDDLVISASCYDNTSPSDYYLYIITY